MSRNQRLTPGQGRGLLLRERSAGEAPVEPIELFFDLVYVFAITQLTHLLLTHMSPRGAGETLLLLMAVWSAWSFTTWITSWFDSRTVPVRLLMVGLMLLSLFMSAAIPGAFGGQGLEFAAAYVMIQVGRNALTLLAIGRTHLLSRHFLRVLIWSVLLGVLWIAGGIVEGDVRFAIWAGAVALDYLATWFDFPLPMLGRSGTAGWPISGSHLAERNELFIILAMGESILVTGGTFSEIPRSPAAIGAFIVAFIGSVALWWLYFDRGAGAGRAAISRAADPSWLGLSAYSFFHLPMVAGIIMAAGADEMAIAHPLERASWPVIMLILGGPALYLVGNALFAWALIGHVPRSRLVAIAALVALIPLAHFATLLQLGSAAMVMLVGLALWDARETARRRDKES